MSFASGPGKILTVNEETVFATLVASGGVSLDRVTSGVDLTKATYKSAAIRRDQQIAISRHGVRSIGGPINAELNPGAYTRVIQAHIRRDFVAGPSTTAVTTVSTVDAAFVRSGGSFLSDGFKVGGVVSASGFTGTATGVNAQRLLVTGVGSGTMNVLNMDGSAAALGTNTAGDTVTLAEVGKTTYVPSTGHTDKSFTIEHWFSDIAQSEAFVGCKVSKMTVTLPTTGLCTVAFDVMGKDIQTGTAQQLTTPSAATAGNGLASVNGVVLVNGVPSGILNSLNFVTDGQMAVDSVVGSNTTPFVWPGSILGTGQVVAFFEDAAFRDYFREETEISIVALLTTDNTPTADFQVFTLPRVKVNGATKDDKQTGGIKLTGTIEFLRNVDGGTGTTSEDTTIRIQDSLA